ncbi:MAG: c-type cytochrome [Myxococcales bacterium]|nr:c-type cytochrome [Myxococcales bacterium]
MTKSSLTIATALLALCAAACNHDRESKQPTASGDEIFQLCVSCHGPNGQGEQMFDAPAIAGLPQWYVESALKKFRNGARGTHPGDQTGMQMRPMALSLHNDADIETIAAYVARMTPPSPGPTLEGGDASRGQSLYAPCTACHGQDGTGNEQLKAPPIRQMSDWYMLTQLEKFKSGARGTNPKDLEGAQMRPNAVALADEQAMKDVLAYVKTLK